MNASWAAAFALIKRALIRIPGISCARSADWKAEISIEIMQLVDLCISVQGVLGYLRSLGSLNSRSHLTLSTQSSMHAVASVHQLRHCPENQEVAEAHTTPRPPSPRGWEQSTWSPLRCRQSVTSQPTPRPWRTGDVMSQLPFVLPGDRGRQVRVRQGPGQTPISTVTDSANSLEQMV